MNISSDVNMCPGLSDLGYKEKWKKETAVMDNSVEEAFLFLFCF
jgi:hypothetical protein